MKTVRFSSSGSTTHSTSAAASAASFKGSLLLLQNKTKRDPESYREEFLAQLRHFDALSKVTTTAARLTGGKSASASSVLTGTGAAAAAAAAATATNTAATASASSGGGSGTASAAAQEDAQFSAVLIYLCHVSHCYPKECAHIPDVLLSALRASGSKMNPITRRTFVQCIALLRSKNLVTPDKTMPVLFDLLLVRDKILRKNVLSHIVSDIRRFNTPKAKVGNAQHFNRVVQSFLFGVVNQDDPTQTRCAMFVMLDLYRRGVWANEQCVAVMVQACFSRHTAVIRTALRFFLMQFPRRDDEDGEDPHEEAMPNDKALTEAMTRAVHKQKIKHSTKKRTRVLKRVVKTTKNKLDPDRKEKMAMQRQDIDPMRLLRDPQSFGEKLFSALQRTTERFEVRLLFLSVIARVVAEHQVVILQLYPYLERFLQPSQIQAPTLLALASTCVHPLVPPDAVEPLVRSIANHFVNDRSQPDAITIGLNTIREICKRQPLAMSEDLLRDLVEYRSMRGERGIIMAARSLIQLYRQVDPTMLPPKLRAGHEVTQKPQFGAPRANLEIPGLEGLYSDKDEGEEGEGGGERDLKNNDGDDDDGASSSSSSSMIDIPLSDDDDSDSDGSGGGWEWQEDDEEGAEAMSDNDQEGFVDVPQSSSSSSDDEADDEEDDDEEGDEEGDDVSLASEEEKKNIKKPFQVSRADQHLVNSKRFADDIWQDSDDEDDDGGGEAVSAKQKMRTARGGDQLKKRRCADDEQGGEIAVVDNKQLQKQKKQQHQQPKKSESPPRLIPADRTAKHAVAASAASGLGWAEDTEPAKTVSNNNSNKRGQSSSDADSVLGGSSIASSSRTSTTRFLTDADFERLRRIQAGADPNDWRSPRGKKKALLEMKKRKKMLIDGGAGQGDMVETSAIESFTDGKRSRDKETKITAAQEARKERQPFNIRKKKKSKLHSTHNEKSKRGKLFQMTKRSMKVGAKMKMSVEDRREKQKEMKKKNIKFRIARGWKA